MKRGGEQIFSNPRAILKSIIAQDMSMEEAAAMAGISGHIFAEYARYPKRLTPKTAARLGKLFGDESYTIVTTPDTRANKKKGASADV